MLFDHQGAKSFVKLEDGVISNRGNVAKCSFRGGGYLSIVEKQHIPHLVPQHPVATQYQGQP